MQISKSLAVIAFLAGSALASPVAAPAPAPAPGFLDPVADETSAGGINKRSFVATCEEPGIVEIGNARTLHLKARCSNQSGGSNDALLNLDLCLTNDDGTVKWRKNGNLSPSCLGAQGSLHDGGYLTVFSCKDRNGNGYPTTIDLNTKMHNSNGNLRCDV